MSASSLNTAFSKPTMRRRYEVWFLRLALADGSGAWWFRYLLLNPGRRGGGGCPGHALGQPVQVWATWFPRGDAPRSFIQGFSQETLNRSARGVAPFHLEIADNHIGEDSCKGRLEVEGHRLTWDLRYRSTLGLTLSNVGWIGFSRTPHSDAVFSGEITLDGRRFAGEPLGFGLQGHNCGFRHRNFWNWGHCLARQADGSLSTFEALVYETPLGRVRRAALWHGGRLTRFRGLETTRRDRYELVWGLRARNRDYAVEAVFDGGGLGLHRLPYLTTDCRSTFEVANNSRARARVCLRRSGQPEEELRTEDGAVVEMVGE